MPPETDSRGEKIQTTVRMDPVLHRQLSDYVYESGRNLAPRERPSADSVIQQALRKFLAESSPRLKSTGREEEPPIPKAYLPLVHELVQLLQEPDNSRHRHWRDAVRDLLQARLDDRKKQK